MKTLIITILCSASIAFVVKALVVKERFNHSDPKVAAESAICVTSIALAEDFKTVKGKEYKNATVSRVEPDGVVLKHKSGISKVYFVELPKEARERFHYDPAKAAQFNAAEQAAIAQSNAKVQQEATAKEKAAKAQLEKAQREAQREAQVLQVVQPQWGVAQPPVGWMTSIGGGGNLPPNNTVNTRRLRFVPRLTIDLTARNRNAAMSGEFPTEN